MIKRGDNVIILTGKYKGKTGKVEKVLRKEEKVIIPGLNIFKSHQRTRKGGQKGQIVEKSMPVHVSNVKLADEASKKPKKKAKE